MSNYISFNFDWELDGNDCIIKVVDFIHVKPHRGSPLTCDSDLDYYGYTEYDTEVVNPDGSKPDWMTPELQKKAEDAVITHLEHESDVFGD